MKNSPFRSTKLLSLILLGTAGVALTYSGAQDPLVLCLLPIPFMLASVIGPTAGVLPLAVGLGLFARRSWSRKLSVYYGLLLMADGALHLVLWFWTGGLIGPPYGFLGVARVLEGVYLLYLAMAALKEW
jgi:hypothetical protein